MKEKLNRIKTFCSEHFEELLMVGMFAGGIVCGVIYGYDKGYLKGAKNAVDMCTSSASHDRVLMEDTMNAIGGMPLGYFNLSKENDPNLAPSLIKQMVEQNPDFMKNNGLTESDLPSLGLSMCIFKNFKEED